MDLRLAVPHLVRLSKQAKNPPKPQPNKKKSLNDKSTHYKKDTVW